MNVEQKPMAAIPSSAVKDTAEKFLRELKERHDEIEAARISTDEVYQKFRASKPRGLFDKWTFSRLFANDDMRKAEDLINLARASEFVMMTSRDLLWLQGLSVDSILANYERQRTRFQDDLDKQGPEYDSALDGVAFEFDEGVLPSATIRDDSQTGKDSDDLPYPNWWVVPAFIGVVVAIVALFSN